MEITKEDKELMLKEIEAVVHKYAVRGCCKTATRLGQELNEMVRIWYKYGYDLGFTEGIFDEGASE